jgi:Tol biopolymer transport system component
LPKVTHCQDDPHTISKAVFVDINARAQVFAPGIVSSRFDEWATSFTPDNKTVYFSRGGRFWTICFAKNIGGVWRRPQVASFSGIWKDTDPFVSPDGEKIFFVSNRPLDGMPQDKPNKRFHLWYVDHTQGDEWGKPHHVDGGVNIDSGNNYGPSVSAKGTLYWCSRDREVHKGMQGYCANWLGDHYGPAELLSINGSESIQDPFISADEKYLVFLNGADLYISLRQGNGWSVAQNLGPQVNTGDGNSSPYVSHDGKILYYSSARTQGFYERNNKSHALNYDELEKENDGWFNGNGNILMISLHLPDGTR